MGQIALSMTDRAPCGLPIIIEINPKERTKMITTRNRACLLETHVKRPVANKKTIRSSDKEHVEQIEQTTKLVAKESSNTPWIKEAIPINPYEPPVPFFQRLKKNKLDQPYTIL